MIFFFFSHGFSSTIDREIESAYRITFTDDIGYALIGAKPIATDDLQDLHFETHPQVLDQSITSLKSIFKDSDRFVLKTAGFCGEYKLELIHRKALGQLVAKNTFLQRYIKSEFQSEKEFYKKLEDPETSVFRIIKDEFILGILFGYGEENAEHFCRRSILGYHLKKPPYVWFINPDINIWTCLLKPDFPQMIDFPYTAYVPEVMYGFDSLESEWEWRKMMNWDMWSMVEESTAKPPYFINLPSYVCTHTSESKIIREKYIRARKKLARLFDDTPYQQAVDNEVHKKMK